MIEFTDISKRYSGRTNFLENFSLRLDSGARITLTGPTNSGKTTVLRMLAGLEAPNGGTLTLNGENIYRLRESARARLRQRMGLIFHAPQFLPHSSLLDNVSLPLQLQGLSRQEQETRAKGALQRVGLGDTGNITPAQLTENARQRLNIARALVHRPALLLVDDVYTGWPDEMTSLLATLLADFHQGGVTMIVASPTPLPSWLAKTRLVTLAGPTPEIPE
ncbi:MAG: ATP-binding cassette domain-containing protein [Ferrovum sp.]|nr:ATP-binding cassette domain-containing protein [Ferrovum sp.]